MQGLFVVYWIGCYCTFDGKKITIAKQPTETPFDSTPTCKCVSLHRAKLSSCNFWVKSLVLSRRKVVCMKTDIGLLWLNTYALYYIFVAKFQCFV